MFRSSSKFVASAVESYYTEGDNRIPTLKIKTIMKCIYMFVL